MDFSVEFPFFLFTPIFKLWPLLSFAIPALVIYGLSAYGLPMVWINTDQRQCTYLDPIGYVSVGKFPNEDCRWFVFREIQFLSPIQNIGGK